MRNFDYSKLIHKSWDTDIVRLIAQIHEFKGRETLFLQQKPESLARLIDNAKIQSVEFSNKIEIIKQDQRTWKFFQTLPYKQITMVIGEDEWKDLKAGKWHYSNDILNTYNILTIPRTDDVSSSKVRELLKKNVDKNELLKYITKTTYNILKGVENE